MNKTISDFTRAEILNGLSTLPEAWQRLFKQMYSHKDIDKPIEEVVAKMPDDKLDWALSQVENSIKKLQAKAEKIA